MENRELIALLATRKTCWPNEQEIVNVNGDLHQVVETQVTFIAEQAPKGGWRIKCHCPGGKLDYVTGFLDEQSIHNWLASEHRDHWLTVRGY